MTRLVPMSEEQQDRLRIIARVLEREAAESAPSASIAIEQRRVDAAHFRALADAYNEGLTEKEVRATLDCIDHLGLSKRDESARDKLRSLLPEETSDA